MFPSHLHPCCRLFIGPPHRHGPTLQQEVLVQLSESLGFPLFRQVTPRISTIAKRRSLSVRHVSHKCPTNFQRVTYLASPLRSLRYWRWIHRTVYNPCHHSMQDHNLTVCPRFFGISVTSHDVSWKWLISLLGRMYNPHPHEIPSLSPTSSYQTKTRAFGTMGQLFFRCLRPYISRYLFRPLMPRDPRRSTPSPSHGFIR